MNNPDRFEKQLSEILDASTGTEVSVHNQVQEAPISRHYKNMPDSPSAPTTTPKGRLLGILIRIFAVITVLILLYLFGVQIAFR